MRLGTTTIVSHSLREDVMGGGKEIDRETSTASLHHPVYIMRGRTARRTDKPYINRTRLQHAGPVFESRFPLPHPVRSLYSLCLWIKIIKKSVVNTMCVCVFTYIIYTRFVRMRVRILFATCAHHVRQYIYTRCYYGFFLPLLKSYFYFEFRSPISSRPVATRSQIRTDRVNYIRVRSN